MASYFKKMIAIVTIVLFTATAVAETGKLKSIEYQPYVANLVSNFLSLYHYSGLNLDDDLSKRVFKEYLESLDYNRMFFLESDIQQFRAWETQFDDQLRMVPANVSTAFLIYNRFRQRVDERVENINELLDQEFDFTKVEGYVLRRHEQPWAKSKDELNQIWRRRLKEDLIRFELQGKPKKDTLDLLRKRYERLSRNNRDLDETDVLETFLSSVARTFDPHSAYLKPMTKENFDIEMGHSLEGIGATLRTEGEYTVVAALVKGGPAEKSSKIKPEDKIIGVAQGKKGEYEDVVDLRLDKVVKKIRGPKGSLVRLLMIPGDAKDYSQTKEVALIRDRVEITAMDAKAEIMEMEGENGNAMRVGVIEIPSFYMDTSAKVAGDPNYKSTTRDVRRLIAKLESKNIDGLVIDLRQNGGGALDEAIELTGVFIDEGPVVQVRDFNGRVRVHRDPDDELRYRGPLVVLTSVFSASASEIFAGAIQDYDRGVVVGAKSTHGKGTVQNIFSLQPSLNKQMRRAFAEDVAGALKMTTLKFYRISGSSTQFKGVEPDVVLPSPYDDLDVGEEDLDYALPWDEIDAVPHKNYGLVRDLVPVLKANSAKRLTKNNEFQYLAEDSAYRKKNRERNSVSLVLAERQKEKEELEAKENARDESRKIRVSGIKTDETIILENNKAIVAPEDEKPDENKAETIAGAEKDDEEKVAIPDYILEECLMVMRDYISLRGEGFAGLRTTRGKKDSL
ncbi:Carboxy terminal-processing peptidase [Sulfidibacter corallicola]|uniref:Carboxy terminal-processing peptidase n=1 Tax=Sulfidibacter corallicola TaxID=2818388 RepID=A0A8A4TDF0_SULCO|nr:carboxy terminal-processing peptidase [Sulfidibacter corallicola]QTD47683.1 carboxy terminal-processing peptidase [Sulfidibacter corallicola]